jgi:hypothetical protein
MGLAANPEPCGLWFGKVGKSDVAVSLGAGEKPAGRYAYLRFGKSIPLAGVRSDAALTLDERGGKGGKPSGAWALTTGPAEALTGTWRSPDGKRSEPVALTCLGSSGGQLRDPWYAANLPGKTSAQQYEAFVRQPEVPGKVSSAGEGGAIRHVTLLNARDEYDLITQHPFPKALAAVNAAIRARVAKAVKENRECLAEGLQCDINATIAVSFLSPRYTTVEVDGYYDGGGAHPDSDREIWVYSLAEGGAQRVNVASFYQLKTSDERYQPAFWKLIEPGARARDRDDRDLTDCPDGDDGGETLQLGLAEGGLDVDVSFSAHVIAACGYSVFVKAAALAPFLRPHAPEVFRTGKF